ncbi:ATP synthase subunit delta, mitochondrial [Neolecta irregularis DAH-3]|uniref:ATP synthase subunit delta, mitochondrial n=1 Tax=Neolecta irregularis (strain DAH-3) TaxID=1198029 RepID=A0A1U7LQ28_NEOID|nr:ATP synthase subunit delta, mitochondrial [Neolecta irregularis DAH-3]|eukprot:OLL24776.1 ATP synthase subunit delta, mitochondrial [Neolecta irregularis DAH-3]
MLCRSAILRVPFRRGYATVTDTLALTLSVPHKALFNATAVQQVNLPGTSGDMGILANHVACIEQLKPGVVEIIGEDNSVQKYFVSGGFAVVQPNSILNINAIEASPLEDFNPETVQKYLADAERSLSSGNEEEKLVAEVEVEVLNALSASLK